MRSIVCLSVLLLAPLSDALAQAPTPLQPGQRVRITAPEFGLNKQAAAFEAMKSERLIVVADSSTSIPIASVTRIDAYRGRHGHPWLGAGIGFVVGAAGGALLGVAACNLSGGDCTDQSAASLYPSAAGALVGGIVGMGIGSAIKTDKWEEVPLDNLRVSIVLQREGRFALAASVRF